jgi:hypothetical protein
MACSILKQLMVVSVLSSACFAWSMGSRSPASTATVLSARWEGKHPDGRDWTLFTYKEVSKVAAKLATTTPTDYKDFCPEYKSLSDENKRNFWVYLLSSMAQLESNFNPSLSYREAFRDGSGNYVMSRGLLQISIESGNAYGCGFKSQSDLNDPYRNLSCGLRVLNKWVVNDKRIAGSVSGSWRGGSRYWSVLRTATKVNSIKSWTRGFCSANF